MIALTFQGYQPLTNDDLLPVFADKSGGDLDSELSESAKYAACIEKLWNHGNLGYTVWSINGTMETIGASPDTQVASDLIECLVRWFFVEKLETGIRRSFTQWMENRRERDVTTIRARSCMVFRASILTAFARTLGG
jgi:hypothetical protein